MSERVERWKSAWESLDLDRIVALYAKDATHTSRLVHQLNPEIGGCMLRGVDQIREYVARGLVWFVKLEIQISAVLECDTLSAIEYLRESNIDPVPARVVEMLEWSGPYIRAARVYHF
jgi:SnoaL-like domain